MTTQPTEPITINTGILLKEKLSPTDFMSGSGAIPYKVVCDEWKPYLPLYENQFSTKADFMRCATEGALNSLEIQLNRAHAVNELSEGVKKWLVDNGYVLDKHIQFSKRFTAKMSGTGPNGNYLEAVWDSIRNHGVLPESDWPTSPTMSWDEHYAEIPQHLKDKALKFKEIFSCMYQWVVAGASDRNDQQQAIRHAVRQAPVQIASMAIQGSPQPVKDRGCGSQHSVAIYAVTDRYMIFDHYPNYLFEGALDFCIPWAGQIIITPKESLQVDISQYEGKVIEAPTGNAYWIQEGKRRWSPDLTTFWAHNLLKKDIIRVNQATVDAIPMGLQMHFREAPLKPLFEDMKREGYVHY